MPPGEVASGDGGRGRLRFVSLVAAGDEFANYLP